MYADIEQLVLSGELFKPGGSRSSTPERQRSPSPGAKWPAEKDYDSAEDDAAGTARNEQVEKIMGHRTQDSIGMGPGRTGVKGVIRDRDEARAKEHARRAREIDEMNRKMERAAITAPAFREEEPEPEAGARSVFGERKGRFGHLREVGVRGFVPAVEEEARGVWVVVHLYDASLERCFVLDDALARLARRYPDTKFIHARAAALGFASKPSAGKAKATAKPRSGLTRAARSSRAVDEDDPYDEKRGFVGGSDEEEDVDDDDDDDVDTDMLPTMLVYRDGELVFNWVRVDWEAGEAGVEDLLVRHHVLPQGVIGNDNCGLPSDDEEEFFSDGDV